VANWSCFCCWAICQPRENRGKQSRRKSSSRWKVGGGWVWWQGKPGGKVCVQWQHLLRAKFAFPQPPSSVLVAINCLQFWQLAKVAADTLPLLSFFFYHFLSFFSSSFRQKKILQQRLHFISQQQRQRLALSA